MTNKIVRNTIGYLMYLANNGENKDFWYPLKKKLCDRFGYNDGNDIQELPGKMCNCCYGTGKYEKYTYAGRIVEPCRKCFDGWYQLPRFVLLRRIKVGRYLFHFPIRSEVSLLKVPEQLTSTAYIKGYITHGKKKYGWLAFSLLIFLFDFKGYMEFVKSMGAGWRISWWLPKNWIYNIRHLIKFGWESIPIKDIKKIFKNKNQLSLLENDGDLPF